MIGEKILSIKKELPQGVDLVAVSKFHTVGEIMEAYNAGQRCFGENRPQELAQKVSQLPSDIEWHFLGNLQKNKIKLVAPHASLIHSVESAELLYMIDRFARNNNIQTRCLLEVYIASEESKHGFLPEEIYSLLARFKEEPLTNTTICGLMGMASFTSDESLIRDEFKSIKRLFEEIKVRFPEQCQEFNTLSIGMSGDYKIAIEEGSTMVRIGTSIFGPRNY